MKNRNLYIAYTPFQLIISIIIQKYYNHDDYGDICIINNFANATDVKNKLEKLDAFNNVLLVDCSNEKGSLIEDLLFNQSAKLYLNDYIYNALYICVSGYTSDFNNECYDLLQRRNPLLKVFGYVEGYSSYTEQILSGYKAMSIGHKFLLAIREIFLKKKKIDSFDLLFVFNRSLLNENIRYKTVDMKNINITHDSKLYMLLSSAFGYSNEKHIIKEKFIFFEECFSEDNGRQEDLDLVNQIVSIVGKDNLIIKRHPRNKFNRFKQFGYKTLECNGIPWEIYALDKNQPRHILITHSSGAALNFRFFTDNGDYTVLLYKYFKYAHFNDMSKDTERWFLEYEKLFNDRVFSPEDLDALKNILSRCCNEIENNN